jgi:hypothetical protein
MDCIKEANTIARAARRFMGYVGGERTPDGAVYNFTCVREVLSGLAE